MPLVAWVTIVIATVIIAVAALGLLRVIFHLRAVTATLDSVIGGVGLIAERTSTVPEVLRRAGIAFRVLEPASV